MSLIQESCKHTIIAKGLCCSCGKFVDLKKTGLDERIALLHSKNDIFVSNKIAHQIGFTDRERLLKSKKLVLIIDLDQTIIHSFCFLIQNLSFPELEKTKDTIKNIMEKNQSEQHIFHQHRDYIQYTFLRSKLFEFLEKLQPYFEFHIFTMGSRDYAVPIIKYLDPDEKLFFNRVKTRNECTIKDNKIIELKSIFPCGDDMVCILDDRLDVWGNLPNVIQVCPFIDKNVRKMEQSLIRKQRLDSFETVKEDEYLLDLAKLLIKVHKIYFSQLDTNQIYENEKNFEPNDKLKYSINEVLKFSEIRKKYEILNESEIEFRNICKDDNLNSSEKDQGEFLRLQNKIEELKKEIKLLEKFKNNVVQSKMRENIKDGKCGISTAKIIKNLRSVLLKEITIFIPHMVDSVDKHTLKLIKRMGSSYTCEIDNTAITHIISDYIKELEHSKKSYLCNKIKSIHNNDNVKLIKKSWIYSCYFCFKKVDETHFIEKIDSLFVPNSSSLSVLESSSSPTSSSSVGGTSNGKSDILIKIPTCCPLKRNDSHLNESFSIATMMEDNSNDFIEPEKNNVKSEVYSTIVEDFDFTKFNDDESKQSTIIDHENSGIESVKEKNNICIERENGESVDEAELQNMADELDKMFE